MFYNKKQRSFSTLISLYLLVSVILFSLIILLWTYHTSNETIDMETKSNFQGHFNVAENILEYNLDSLTHTLKTIYLNNFFYKAFLNNDKINLKKILNKLKNFHYGFKLDILFITKNQSIFINKNSSLYQNNKLFKELLKKREIPPIVEVKNLDKKFNILIKKLTIIHKKTGKVLGFIYGGIILNNNFTLIETIRLKTKALSLSFFYNGSHIASTDKINSPYTIILKQTRTMKKEKNIHYKKIFVNQKKIDIISSYKDLTLNENKTSLEAVFLISAKNTAKLRSLYLQKIVGTLFLSIFFLILTLYIIKKLTIPSLKKLEKYVNNVSLGSINSEYSLGSIKEFNSIGVLMEKMFQNLNQINSKLLNEIDEKNKAKQNLQDANDIINRSKAVVFLWKNAPNWPVELVSKNVEVLFGYTVDDFISKKISYEQTIHPDDINKVASEVKKFSEDPNCFDFVHSPYRIICKNKTIKWVSDKTHIRRNDDKTVTYYEGIVEDITVNKVIEEELIKTKKYLDNIISSMPSALIGIDQKEKITIMNNQAEILSEVSVKDAIGKPFDSIFKNYKKFSNEIKHTIHKRKIFEKQKISLQVNNQQKYFTISVFPLISNDIRGAVIRIDDITNKIILEEMMIQNDKMISLGNLSAGMAHEINNPLSIILQAVQNIKRRVNSELNDNEKIAKQNGTSISKINAYLNDRKIFTYLDAIEEAGDRAAKIVMNMLQYSKNNIPKNKRHNINILINKAIQLVQNDYVLIKNYDFKHIKIVKNYSQNEIFIKCNSSEIEQVIINLLKNAAHAMLKINDKNFIPEIIIITKKEKNELLIEISDNGPGIDIITQKRIFEPFYTTKEPGEGTGLGLFVTYFIITKNHNGQISISSDENQGTKFLIRFPIL